MPRGVHLAMSAARLLSHVLLERAVALTVRLLILRLSSPFIRSNGSRSLDSEAS